MPTFSSSFSSTSFSSFSSSSSVNGQATGTRYASHSQSNPSGTTTQTMSQTLGQPVIQETRHYDGQGREMLGAPQAAANNQRRIQDIEVEDVTETEDADKKYKEAIEEEYAKREGGA